MDLREMRADARGRCSPRLLTVCVAVPVAETPAVDDAVCVDAPVAVAVSVPERVAVAATETDALRDRDGEDEALIDTLTATDSLAERVSDADGSAVTLRDAERDALALADGETDAMAHAALTQAKVWVSADVSGQLARMLAVAPRSCSVCVAARAEQTLGQSASLARFVKTTETRAVGAPRLTCQKSAGDCGAGGG